MLRPLIKPLITYPLVTLVIFAALFVFVVQGAVELQIDPSFSSLISDEGQYNTNARILETAFQENNALIIFFTIDETSDLRDRPATLYETTIEQDAQEMTDLLLVNSQYVTRVTPLQISDNGKFAQMVVRIFEPNSIEGLANVQKELSGLIDQARLPVGVEVSITGLPVLLERISFLLINDNLRTVLITAALVFGILLWYFRNWKLAFIGVISPLASLASLAALMALLDIHITITLAAVGVIVIGLGADYSIHVISAYMRELREGLEPQEALLTAMDELDIALLAAFLTTLAGFCALVLGVSPSSQAQGFALSLAITVIFLVSLFLLPPMLVAFVHKAPKQARKSFAFLEKIFDKLAHFQTRHPVFIIIVVLLVTVVMFFGAAKVTFSTSNSNWIPDDDPISVSFREQIYAFGDSDNLILVIESTRGDLRTPATVQDIQELTTRLEGLRDLTSISSPFTGISSDRSEIYDRTQEPAIKAQFNRDYTLTTISLGSEGFDTNDAGDSVIIEEVQEILSQTSIHNAKVSLFGDVIRFDELGRSLQQDTAVTTLIGLVLVFVVSSILYASFAIGLVALVPIIIAVLWAVGLMGFFNVPFTSLSSGIVSLVLGIGVDFSLHLVNSIKNRLEEGRKAKQAIEQALNTTGGAIFLSSVTTFFGFLALTFANLLGTQRLGWSLGFSIVSVFIVAVLFVPAVVSLRTKVLGRST